MSIVKLNEQTPALQAERWVNLQYRHIGIAEPSNTRHVEYEDTIYIARLSGWLSHEY